MLENAHDRWLLDLNKSQVSYQSAIEGSVKHTIFDLLKTYLPIVHHNWHKPHRGDELGSANLELIMQITTLAPFGSKCSI